MGGQRRDAACPLPTDINDLVLPILKGLSGVAPIPHVSIRLREGEEVHGLLERGSGGTVGFRPFNPSDDIVRRINDGEIVNIETAPLPIGPVVLASDDRQTQKMQARQVQSSTGLRQLPSTSVSLESTSTLFDARYSAMQSRDPEGALKFIADCHPNAAIEVTWRSSWGSSITKQIVIEEMHTTPNLHIRGRDNRTVGCELHQIEKIALLAVANSVNERISPHTLIPGTKVALRYDLKAYAAGSNNNELRYLPEDNEVLQTFKAPSATFIGEGSAVRQIREGSQLYPIPLFNFLVHSDPDWMISLPVSAITDLRVIGDRDTLSGEEQSLSGVVQRMPIWEKSPTDTTRSSDVAVAARTGRILGRVL